MTNVPAAHSQELLSKPLSEVSLTFVDVETTGLSPARGDRVCEIGLIRLSPGQSEESFDSLVDPQRPVSPGAAAVNGITADMLDGAPRFGTIAPRVDALLADAVLVAHNASFDLGFLRSEFCRLQRPFPMVTVIDMLSLARRFLRLPSHRLGAVATALDVVPDGAHRALADCRTTRQVLDRIVARVFPDQPPHVADLAEARNTGSEAQAEPLPPPLREAVRNRFPIRIRYENAGGDVTMRTIQVSDVHGAGSILYLEAFCRTARAIRHFRYDRIQHWQILN